MHQSAYIYIYICIVAMALLKRIVSSKGFGGWVLSLRYIKRQERAQTYWNFNNNLKTIGNLFHFINLGHLSVKYTWPASSTFANKFPNRIYVDLVWKFHITMLFNGFKFSKKKRHVQCASSSPSPSLLENLPIFVMEILGLSTARLFPCSPDELRITPHNPKRYIALV